MPYDQAKTAAEVWFESCRMGTVRPGSVEEACKAYVANVRIEKNERAAQFAEWTFKANVYDTAFGRTALDKLRSKQVEDWRNSLVTEDRKQNSVNRILRSFKAAMNYAHRHNMVHTDKAWKVVQQFKASDGQRDTWLEPEQRQALLASASPELATLLRGWLYTAARPMELPAARVKDFDAKTGTITFTTHKGDGSARVRSVPLSPDAVRFFKQQCQSKLPSAFVFTNVTGEPWSRHQYAAEIREAVQKAKLPKGTVAYTMRHIMISEWLLAGIDVVSVAKAAGTSVMMIEKNYAKFIRSHFAERLATVRVV
jgi:integrase